MPVEELSELMGLDKLVNHTREKGLESADLSVTEQLQMVRATLETAICTRDWETAGAAIRLLDQAALALIRANPENVVIA